jgi:hypothetical protein
MEQLTLSFITDEKFNHFERLCGNFLKSSTFTLPIFPNRIKNIFLRNIDTEMFIPISLVIPSKWIKSKYYQQVNKQVLCVYTFKHY